MTSISYRNFDVDFDKIDKSGIVLSLCNFNDIDVITDVGAVETKSFVNFAIT